MQAYMFRLLLEYVYLPFGRDLHGDVRRLS